ncbi:DNA-binding response regulator [Acuticoccus sediminis]|uniref:Regulatory protein VirG n=1 Tax=Acuticoccus sediminis TaxID=2184697 RepID=A0A8B2NVA5_9HYPH|nr:response regulator [Acuticoccus sediminis]RAI02238.1 DNA-binding response regulator [Acuticoccus sediminis]
MNSATLNPATVPDSQVDTATVVVVDDDAATRAMLADYLEDNGLKVVCCDGGPALRAILATTRPSLVVLDLNMPGEDGLSLIRFLKATGDVPIIMLTASASLVDRVVGLELGADDYIAKPCELRELLARIRSVLRRSGSIREEGVPLPAAPATPNRTVRFGTKSLDLDARVLVDGEGIEHALTASEFQLLKAFAEHPRRVLSRERLLELAQARDAEAFDRAIDVRITRIRRKVEPDPRRPRVIKTVRGGGYVFTPEA